MDDLQWSVVVCTRDRPVELQRCLAHLCRLPAPGMELLVVDSAPQHTPADLLAARFGARYLHETVPGLSRARNTGARAARGAFVAFLDDDALPATDWLAKMLPPFADGDVAVVTGAIHALDPRTDAEITWEARGGFRPPPGSPTSMDLRTPGWFVAAHFGALGNGSNMAFRRSVFLDWRGFNEGLGRGHRIPGGEEHFAFFELIERGHRVVHEASAVVYHPAPANQALLEQQYLEGLHDGAMYVTYLYVHLPRYRGEIHRLAWNYLRKQFSRRAGPAALSGLGVGRRRQLAALARGMLRYWRSW